MIRVRVQSRRYVFTEGITLEGYYTLREKGQLGPQFIRPFKVVAGVGKVAYRLDLPEKLSQIHCTFHLSQI